MQQKYEKYLKRLSEKKGPHTITVVWNYHSGWNLCSGTWNITVDSIDCSSIIPPNLRHSDMNTWGTYPKWYFDNWSEEWEEPWSYETISGLKYKAWIKENKYWVEKLPIDPIEWPELYSKISDEDFRTGTCGGCI